MEMLTQAAVFFTAAVIVVPIFRKLGLGAVLGYLAAGALIGPFGLKLIKDVELIMHFSEFGVVLLLFIIGLELQPARLWTMRSTVFGLGGAQVLISALIFGLIAVTAGDIGVPAAAVIGLGLALSSTAFVLQTLAERGELRDRHGRVAFAILLFQDMAAIPVLALVPLLGAGHAMNGETPVLVTLLKVVGVVAAVIIGGNLLLRPVLRAVAAARTPELFTATALLIVSVTSLLMDSVGISMALGAFLAGMLLANSEYRHQLEADIEPFKGLLLGLFFIAVGMGLNLGLLRQAPAAIALLVVSLMVIKGIVVYALGRIWGLNAQSAKSLGLAIPQGGEFAFVIFTAAVTAGVLSKELEDLLVVVVSVSMAATPAVSIANDWLTRGFVPPQEAPYHVAPTEEAAVIIAGFGRFGQITGRILAARHIPFTALDISAAQVDFVKKFGADIFYGDASRIDLLRAAKADKAKVLVLAIDDMEASLRTAETVAKNFPHIKIYARARNRQHAYRLMDLGVTTLRRETFLSSLDLSREVLMGLGMKAGDAEKTIQTFRAHDEKRLFEHYTHYDDDEKLQSLVKASAKELEEMFARDAIEGAGGEPVVGKTDRGQRAA